MTMTGTEYCTLEQGCQLTTAKTNELDNVVKLLKANPKPGRDFGTQQFSFPQTTKYFNFFIVLGYLAKRYPAVYQMACTMNQAENPL
jgi:hypothetical protein